MLEGRLPRDLLSRKKEGFNAPINFWVENWPSTIRDELLNSFSPFLETILDKEIIGLWLDNKNLRRRAGATLYSIFILNKWININLNKNFDISNE